MKKKTDKFSDENWARRWKLDTEERAIEESADSGKWRSVDDFAAQRKILAKAAQATLRKDQRINLRMNSHDLSAIKSLAAREGLPYQTLMSSVLHKYAAGLLVEDPTSRV